MKKTDKKTFCFIPSDDGYELLAFERLSFDTEGDAQIVKDDSYKKQLARYIGGYDKIDKKISILPYDVKKIMALFDKYYKYSNANQKYRAR